MRGEGLKTKGIPAGCCSVPLVMYMGRCALPPAGQEMVSDVVLSSLSSVTSVTNHIHQNATNRWR